jgi:hypothetical protein
VTLRRRYGQAPKFIAVLELQKSGNPHLHVLIDRFIEQAWLSSAWVAVGGGRIVDIRWVRIRSVSRYLAKYLTEELFFSAPRRSRRITCSRSITLFPVTPPKHAWTFLKKQIDIIFALMKTSAIAIDRDDEGELQGFSVLQL